MRPPSGSPTIGERLLEVADDGGFCLVVFARLVVHWLLSPCYIRIKIVGARDVEQCSAKVRCAGVGLKS